MAASSNLAVWLTELAAQVRSVTVRQLEVAEPTMHIWAPPGTANHILWHAGHVAWTTDLLTIEPITGRSELPADWAERFGDESRPASRPEWPAAQEVTLLLRSQLDRVLNLYVERAESIVARANEHMPQNGWSLLRGILHGWHDEARHQGEMHLLAKLYRARAGR